MPFIPIPKKFTQHALLPLIILYLVYLFCFPGLSFARSPWATNNGETKLEGIFLALEGNTLKIKINTEVRFLTLEPHCLAAVMGSQAGFVVNPCEFPPHLPVEIFLTPQGTVRAMRNKPETIKTEEGQPLGAWGHDASLSPNGKHFLLYNLIDGLYLHSAGGDLGPAVYLSPFPQAAWNSYGDKIACSLPDALLVYNLRTRSTMSYPLPTTKEGIKRIVTDLSWNQRGDKILCASLQDYPNQGSDLFEVAVYNDRGKRLGATTVPNLGPAIWLNDELILLITYSDMEHTSGEGFLWNFRTAKMTPFLPEKTGAYRNVAYNAEKEILAYTTARGCGEDLYLKNISQHTINKLLSFPFPLRNLQWSNNTLLFWDEYNNTIHEVKNIPLQELSGLETNRETPRSTTVRAAGYLPAKGAGKGFMYFLSEPWEEPQELYLMKPE